MTTGSPACRSVALHKGGRHDDALEGYTPGTLLALRVHFDLDATRPIHVQDYTGLAYLRAGLLDHDAATLPEICFAVAAASHLKLEL